MTQENKELLLKDLCARLPYGVKVLCLRDFNHDWYNLEMVNIKDNEVYVTTYESYANRYAKIEEVKPYLFPLSSITEEIIDEIYTTTGVYDINIDSSVHIEVGTTFADLPKIFDILHKHHIDYRGLIEKDLAIDATGLNIY